MMVRPYQTSDETVLREIYLSTDFHQKPLPDLDKLVSLVVANENDRPLMAAYAKAIPEITLICSPSGDTHPLVKLRGIALIHEALRDRLVADGYTEAIASVPPQLERNYARHLQRHFHWKESWKTYRIRDWKAGV